MPIKDLVLRTRSYRRFHEDQAIPMATLSDLVDLARLAASAANLQPLKYILTCDREVNAAVFPHLAWAGYLKEWPGPPPGERPAAYIIILGDKEISASFGCDHGIAAQNMLLGATEKGLGGCLIGSVHRDELRTALRIPGRYEILLVLALGKPKEKVVLETIEPGGDVKYWRDPSATHHVPKRRLQDIIVQAYPGSPE
ncbi:MAG: nitroreductase family protein [Planctomycetota bacterium]